MEIVGRLDSILEPQTGESAKGAWRKDSFVIETQDQYPKKVNISYFGDKVNINSFNINDEIKVSINIDSREFNGKWYTNVTAWRIEPNQANAGSGAQATSAAPSAADIPPEISDDGDDLPF